MSNDWPTWATAPVRIVAPDPGWPVEARRLRDRLTGCLGDRLDGEVEHVGSTAVPDLPAKPIIDLMAPVTDLADAPACDEVLVADGWELVPPHLDARPWRRFYVLPEGDRRFAHLHLVERRHPRWVEVLRFRDALREDRSLRTAYADLKQREAATHRDDREAYTAAKSAFIEDVVASRIGPTTTP